MPPKGTSSASSSGQQQAGSAPSSGQQQPGSAEPVPSNRALKRARRTEEERAKQAALWEQEGRQPSASEPADSSTVTNTKPAAASKVDALENIGEPITADDDSDLVYSDPEGFNEEYGGVSLEDGEVREDDGEDMRDNTDTVLENVTSALRNGETIEERLPAVLADQDKWMYVKSTEIWHTQTGGYDEPSPASLKTERGIPAYKANVVVTFRESDNIMFTAGSLKGINRSYGEKDSDSMEIDTTADKGKGKQKASAAPTPAEASAIAAANATAAATAAAEKLKAKSEPKEPNYHPVKVQWILNSQVPGFYLEVRRTVPKFGDKEETPVAVHFHVNNMLVRKAVNTPDPKICLVSSLGQDTAARLDPNSGLEAQQTTSTGCLWSTEVEVWKTGHPMPNAALTNAEPTFANITKTSWTSSRLLAIVRCRASFRKIVHRASFRKVTGFFTAS
jgi:hypothetical protein